MATRNRYRNHYEHCGVTWEDLSLCKNNDKCPCGAEIEPFQSDDLAEEEKASLQKELINALIDKGNLTKLKAEDVSAVVLNFLTERAESAESLFDSDLDEDDQVMAFPMPWVVPV